MTRVPVWNNWPATTIPSPLRGRKGRGAARWQLVRASSEPRARIRATRRVGRKRVRMAGGGQHRARKGGGSIAKARERGGIGGGRDRGSGPPNTRNTRKKRLEEFRWGKEEPRNT